MCNLFCKHTRYAILIPRTHIPLSGLADYRRGMRALDTRLRCTCTCMQCGDCNLCDDFPFTVNAVSSCRRRRHQKVAVKVYAAAVLALQIRQLLNSCQLYKSLHVSNLQCQDSSSFKPVTVELCHMHDHPLIINRTTSLLQLPFCLEQKLCQFLI